MAIASPGATMAVDWEKRIDYDRLRNYRLSRARAALEQSDLGAVLLFDPNNIRYVTSTHIGEWQRDKHLRWALLTRSGDPVLWEFSSAAKNHRLYAPWFPEESWKAGVGSMRGAMNQATGVPDRQAMGIVDVLRERGLEKDPVGVDVTDMGTLQALQRLGLEVVDAQPVMLEARKLKNEDEFALIDHAAAIVDAVYEEIYRMLRPGVTENEVVAKAMQILFDLGSEQVEAINAISGERCSPHPHVFADRLIRPGDQAFFDIVHSFMGYRTCYYRTFSVGYATQAQVDAYKQCREWLDQAIDLVRPGITTAEIVSVWPTAKEMGFSSEEECFALQFGHGLGVALYESPMISRLHSLDAPMTIEAGMAFALETYCAANDGKSAARIEEMVLVTPTGPKIVSRFPAEELLVTGVQYTRGADFASDVDASGNGAGLIGTSGFFSAQQAVVKSETGAVPAGAAKGADE
jgi:Xaa-Pro aminopeptidase